MEPRVVIADPHRGMCSALESTVRLSGVASVAGVASDLVSAGRIMRSLRADVLLVDADLLAEHSADLGPLSADTTIIALGMERHPGAAARARRHGASAYVVKNHSHAELADPLSSAVRRSSAPRRRHHG
jgi:DNA-binding NarL/FixJ family response regulator